MMREKRELFAKGFFDSFPDLSVTQPDYRERMADKYFRISCFTKIDTDPFDEILMWSHYANKHFGVRIGFELDNEKRYPYFMKEIIYSRHRVSLDLTTGTDAEKIKSALIEAICTKSEGWRYEREYRFFTTPDLCEERIVNGEAISLIGFDQSNIWTIDFGVKCPDSERKRIAAIAKAQFPGATIRCAEYHKTDFSLEYSEYK